VSKRAWVFGCDGFVNCFLEGVCKGRRMHRELKVGTKRWMSCAVLHCVVPRCARVLALYSYCTVLYCT